MAVKILVVDDDTDIRELLAEVLIRSGFQTNVAENGFVAIEKIRLNRPDLILSDICMPVCDGFALMDCIIQMPEPIPVFFISGYASGDLERLKSYPNYTGFLPKPIRTKVLIDAVKNVIETVLKI